MRSIYSFWMKKSHRMCSNDDSSSSHCNDRYMNTPEKQSKMTSLKKRVKNSKGNEQKLIDTINKLTENEGDTVGDDLHLELCSIMNYNAEKSKTYMLTVRSNRPTI